MEKLQEVRHVTDADGARSDISRLKCAAEAAQAIRISEERLSELADGGFAPHYRVDGGPALFAMSELREWAKNNLIQRYGGRELPNPVLVVPQTEGTADRLNVPVSIRLVVGLIEVTAEVRRTGIYFLCKGNEVVYVGQTTVGAARIRAHYGRKEFERVYFLSWPADDLSRIETAFIRMLKPPYNVSERSTLITSHEPTTDEIAREVVSDLVGSEDDYSKEPRFLTPYAREVLASILTGVPSANA